MPDLLLNDDERDGLRVQSVMAYPNDVMKRMIFEAIKLYGKQVSDKKLEEIIEVPKGILWLLLASKGYEKEMESCSRAMRRGCTAGDVLIFLAQMKLSGVKEPSVRKAVYLTSRYNQLSAHENDERVATTTRGIKICRQDYSSVAHLWAAFRAFQYKYVGRRSEYDFNPGIFERKLPEFLALSETFLEFGAQFRAERAKTNAPLTLKNDAWRVLIDYSIRPFELKLKDPRVESEDWVTQELEKYSACIS